MNLLSIGKGLWKLNIEMIKWNPFKNQIRKLLLKTEDKINNTENQETSKVEIWMKTKKEIMKIGKEKSINQQRMLTKKKNDLQRRIKAEGKNNGNDPQRQSKIIELIKELNKGGKRRIEIAQIIAKAKYIKEGQKSTKYFFNLKKDKKDPSIIKALQNKNGKIINNTNEMCKIVTEYHQSLQKVPERQDKDD